MKHIFLLAVAGVLAIACDRRPSVNFEGGDPADAKFEMAPLLRPAQISSKTVERKLIKNGTIEFSTASVSEMRNEVDKVVKEFNAYVSSDNQQKLDGKIQYEQVIRIPAGRFDAFVKVIEGLGKQIEFRDLATQDVTEEYIDIEARLKTKKELEVRYLQLLSKANNVKEMLAVEEQIANVRSEIESMQGKINYLSDQVSFSTLTVRYYQLISPQLGFGSRLLASVGTGWSGLLAFLIGLVSVWPFILILLASLWLISRWSKKVNLRLRKSQEAV
ncbi:MAG TPA: DUF4349 domain-containing protein [Chryseosolibacter sp.]